MLPSTGRLLRRRIAARDAAEDAKRREAEQRLQRDLEESRRNGSSGDRCVVDARGAES